jgi:hypothetical protein
MKRIYKYFSVTGVANTETLDTGLTSTPEEARKLIGLMIEVSGWAGNKIVVYRDTEKLAELPDYLFHTDASPASTNVQYTTTGERFLPLEHDIKVGDFVKVGISCGATLKIVRGAYIYEVM